MSHSIVCTQCQATLRYSQAPPKPKTIACPKCKSPLVIPASVASNPRDDQDEFAEVRPAAVSPRPPVSAPMSPEHVTSAPPRGRSAPRPVEDDLDDDPPPRRMGSDERSRSRQDEASDRPRRRDNRSRDDFDNPDDDQERPRRRPRKKKSGRGLVIGLCIGIGALVLGGVAVLLIMLLGSGNALVGRWRPELPPGAPKIDAQVEFTSGGEMIVSGGPLGRFSMKYRVIDNESIEIEASEGMGAPMGFGIGGGGGGARRERAYFRIQDGLLTISNRPGGPGMRLRRI